MRFRGPFRILEDWLSAGDATSPGLYHYMRGDESGATRFHLRVEPDGKSILSINAQKIVHMNETATEYARLALEGADDLSAVARIRSLYHISTEDALEDFHDIREKIDQLACERGACPVTYLGVEPVEPFSTPVSAPYRADLALTYRCDNECPHCYVERPRDFEEMDTEQWKKVLDTLWDIGIPHAVFTGGEALLREDLEELIGHAEDLGMITGLLTDGRTLGKGDRMARLAEAGLDHVQVTIESADAAVHDRMTGCNGAWAETVEGIRAALASGVYTITNTTITTDNRDGLPQTVDFLESLGLETIAMNGIIYTGGAREGGMGLPEEEMALVLAGVRDRARERGLYLIWYTPTRYCDLDPVALGLGPKQCTAGKYNICVEPDGGVIPCQSYYQPVGNILTDDWDKIWGSPLFVSLRERKDVSEECRDCDRLALCGGGCPLAGEAGTPLCVESSSNAQS